MTRHLMRLALTASAFFFLFPLIPGANFHGNFAHAILTFSGWIPAIWGGLIMLFIGVITSGDIHVRVRNNKHLDAII